MLSAKQTLNVYNFATSQPIFRQNNSGMIYWMYIDARNVKIACRNFFGEGGGRGWNLGILYAVKYSWNTIFKKLLSHSLIYVSVDDFLFLRLKKINLLKDLIVNVFLSNYQNKRCSSAVEQKLNVTLLWDKHVSFMCLHKYWYCTIKHVHCPLLLVHRP